MNTQNFMKVLMKKILVNSLDRKTIIRIIKEVKIT